MKHTRRTLDEGPLAHRLARHGAPMSVGIFSVLAIGLADAFLLARVGESELAALGFANVVTLWAALVATHAPRIGPSGERPVAAPARRIAMVLSEGDR